MGKHTLMGPGRRAKRRRVSKIEIIEDLLDSQQVISSLELVNNDIVFIN